LPLALGLHQRPGHLSQQRALLPVAHLDRLPGVVSQGRAPGVGAHERHLLAPPLPGVRRVIRHPVAHPGVARPGQEVAFAPLAQLLAEVGAASHLVVAGDPTVRQQTALFVEHLEGQFVPGGEADLFGHAGLLAASFVPGPLLRQEEAEIDQGVALMADVAEVDADLAIVDLAEPAAPLTLHADGLVALLDEGGGVEDQHAVGRAETLADLACKFADEGLVVPGGLAEELLESLAFAVVQVGDALGVLARKVGEQSADVVMSVGAMLATAQGTDEGFEERLQTRQQAAQQSGADLRVAEQLIQAGLIAAFHGSPPPGDPDTQSYCTPTPCDQAALPTQYK